MIKIGDFSRLSRVSVRMLRHYDEMGLLKPLKVDEWTGYRYYSFDQLAQLNRILALKDLGISLEQIGHLLKEGVPLAQLQGMLRLKQAELQQHVGEEQARLRRIESRLRQIEQEGSMNEYEVVIKPVEELTVVSVRKVVPSVVGMQDWFGQQYERIFGWLGQAGLQPGQAMALYYNPEYSETDIDTEAAVVVYGTTTAEPSDGVQLRTLPGGQMAATIHKGSYDDIINAYTAVGRWLEANGHSSNLPIRESYLGMGDDGNPPVTEIQFPLPLPSPPTPLPCGRGELQEYAMSQRDLKKEMKELYSPSAKEVGVVDVPAMSFLMLDGSGDPNGPAFAAATATLYAVAYALKFKIKRSNPGLDYPVMPLEGLWWVVASAMLIIEPPHETEGGVPSGTPLHLSAGRINPTPTATATYRA